MFASVLFVLCIFFVIGLPRKSMVHEGIILFGGALALYSSGLKGWGI
jgi:hypothetical protein